MAISFPGSKSNGQKFTHQNKSWTWDGNSWKGGVSSGSDAGTLDSLNSTQFLRSDVTGGTTGSFGIGTTAPSNKLHVHGANNSIYSIFARSDAKWMYLHSGGTDPAIGWDTGGSMRFGPATSNVGSGFDEKMRITAAGNVGIGTNGPDFNLHVKKDATGAIAKFEGSTGRFIYTGTDTGGQYIEQVGTTAAERKLRIQSSNGSSTYTSLTIDGANQRVYTDGNAKVGIGYDSPASKLDVRGELGANGSAATPTAYFVNNQSGATSGSIYIGASTGIDWKIGKNVTGIANNQNFSIADSSNNRRLDIDATGKVGINNTSPQGVLSIHGGTGTSYSEVESLNGVNFYKFFKVIDTARSLQMENIFIMPALSNGQKYIHFVTTKDGAMGFDLDILCGRSGSERMFGRVSLRGYKYHESDGDYRHGAIESTSSINGYGNYFEINGPVTQYLADSANATQESYTNPGSYWITRIPCYFNGGGSGQVEFTAFLKTMHHNTAPGGTYYMGIV